MILGEAPSCPLTHETIELSVPNVLVTAEIPIVSVSTPFSSGPSDGPDDTATVLAAGVLAATLAAVFHETIGHGIGCVAVGGDVTLLTSIWFRCHGATSLTDAGGAIAGVIFGALALGVPLQRVHNHAMRLMLLMFGAISLLWVAAQLIAHPAFDRDDWHFIAMRMHWPWIWRPLMAVIGVLGYAAIVRWIAVLLRSAAAPGPRAIRLAYLGSAVSAAFAGLMWSPESIRSAVEGLLTLGVAPLGLLVASSSRAVQKHAGAGTIARSWSFLVLAPVIFATFALVQGRGLGPLANVALRQ